MKHILTGMVIFCTMLTGACSTPEPALRHFQVPQDMKKILVVSFRDMSTDTGESSGIRCPLSGKVFAGGKVEGRAAEILDTRLSAILQKHPRFKFISPDQLTDIRSGLSERSDEREILAETGRKLGADAVLTGHIYRFADRVGRKLSVESPASVAFDLHFLRVSDGQVLWSGHFDETQKALTDDLFRLPTFLKRDGQWITAEQMAVSGLDTVMEALALP
ncbi:MAG: hypothetical protein R2941_10825 [Desulfobacterales bacterium]